MPRGAPAAKRATAAESRLRLVGRGLFDRFEAAVAASSLDARRAIRRAGWIGALRGALSGRWPAPREIAALFGSGPVASRRIAVAVAALEARNRLVLARNAGRPLEPFAPLVRWRDAETVAALRPPAILLTAHVGAIYLLGAAFDRLPAGRTVLRWAPQHLPAEGERNATTAGSVESRTNALRAAISELGGGGYVVTTLDGGQGAATDGRVLGRRLDLGQGAFVLARLADAPVIPVVALWEGDRVVCDLAPAVDDAEAAAQWLDRLLAREPRQITLGLLRQLLFGPTVSTAEEQPPRR